MSTHTRDSLARRSETLDREHPEALDLEARAADEAADELRGSIGVLAHDGNGNHAREALRGERHLYAAQVCRWATSRRPEARRGAVRWCRVVLARAEGRAPGGDVVSSATDLIRHAADTAAEVTESLRGDGHVDAHEAAEIAPILARLLTAAHQLAGHLEEVRSADRGSR
jgi:hypothetical protein